MHDSYAKTDAAFSWVSEDILQKMQTVMRWLQYTRITLTQNHNSKIIVVNVCLLFSNEILKKKKKFTVCRVTVREPCCS